MPEEDLVKGGAEEIETLLKEREIANKRIDEQAALFYSMLEYMDNISFQIQTLCHDMQTRVRVIRERNPITSSQQEIVNKSKREAQESVSS